MNTKTKERVMLILREKQAPENIKIYGVWNKIKPYIQKTIICEKCSRYYLDAEAKRDVRIAPNIIQKQNK